jgi:hypothetical protein
MQRLLACSLLGLATLAAPMSLVRAEDGKPQEAAKATYDGVSPIILSLRFADPAEVATILQTSLGIPVIASNSMRAIVVPGGRKETENELKLIESQIRDFEQIAGARLREMEDRRMREEAERRLFAEDEERQRQAQIEKQSISIDFPGGTVGEYIEMVRKASGFDNIVIGSEGVNLLKMPPVKVKRITGTAAVQLLQSVRLTSARGFASVGVEQVSGDPDGVGIDAEPVVVVNRVDNDSGDTAPVISTEVFNLSAYKERGAESLTALIDAVRTAVELQGPSEHFKLALHEGTGLLFVRGAEEDIEIAVRTVRTFTEGASEGAH